MTCFFKFIVRREGRKDLRVCFMNPMVMLSLDTLKDFDELIFSTTILQPSHVYINDDNRTHDRKE
jgi:hypothetical protein